jgi:flagellar biosynthesis/type III secretory pathway protein FliH
MKWRDKMDFETWFNWQYSGNTRITMDLTLKEIVNKAWSAGAGEAEANVGRVILSQKQIIAALDVTVAGLQAKLNSNQAWHVELEKRIEELTQANAEQFAANTKLYQEGYNEGKKATHVEAYLKGKRFILDEVKQKVGNALDVIERHYGATEK